MKKEQFTNESENPEVRKFISKIREKDGQQTEFIQALQEISESVFPFIKDHKKYSDAHIMERFSEPERTIIFRVPWVNDRGEYRQNRGFRVQMNSAIGPYKGGIRFHPSVNLSILKFLAIEQVLKNSLTNLPLGGGKGGSDFDPKGKSENEIMRFCQSFMLELSKYIGPDIDVPAGDIGVGAREIGYMFGQYKRINNKFEGMLTGKGTSFGGSFIRPEATGYGCVYFAEDMLKVKSDGLKGKKCLISGSGNVALHLAEQLLEKGAKVLTLSDSGGFIYSKNGISGEELKFIMQLKFESHGKLKEFADKYNCEFHEGKKPWAVPGEIAFPAATQNEISEEDARTLIDNGCFCVCEGANMPSSRAAVEVFKKSEILFGPGKAANAGGVAVSGLEMSQNATVIPWTKERVNSELIEIMKNIHRTCLKYGKKGDAVDYEKGANIGGFIKVADAMLAGGVV